MSETPFYADRELLGNSAFTLSDEPPEADDYVASPAGAAYERFFADVVWIGVDAMEGGLLGYWTTDPSAGVTVIRIDSEGTCVAVAGSVVDYVADVLEECEDPQKEQGIAKLADFCRRAGLAPPGTREERRAAQASRPDPEPRWERLIWTEWVRLQDGEAPARPVSASPVVIGTPAGVVVLSARDAIQPNEKAHSVFLFDPGAERFELLPPVDIRGWIGHGLGRLPDGRAAFIVWNGDQHYCLMFDPAGRFWQVGAPSPLELVGCGATVLADGRILVAGGAPARSKPPAARCEIYDPTRDEWADTGEMATPRSGGSLVPVDGGALIVGGTVQDSGPGPTVLCERFDLATGQWSAAADLPFPVTKAMPGPSGGQLVAVGGQGWAVYDPQRDSWSRAAALALPDGAAVRLDDTRVVFFGAASGHPPESVSILDISTATLTLAGRSRLPRGDATAHLLPDGSVLLVGGRMPAPFRHIFQEPEIWRPTKGLGDALPGLAEPLDRQAGIAANATSR